MISRLIDRAVDLAVEHVYLDEAFRWRWSRRPIGREER